MELSPRPGGFVPKQPIQPPQKPPVVPLWKIEDLAKYMGRSVQGAYKFVERYKVPHFKPGGLLLFDPVEVRKWLEQFAVNGPPPKRIDPSSGPKV